MAKIVKFTGLKKKKKYPELIRQVVYYDSIGNRTLVFYTNNMSLTAEEVSELYKNRWSVELFFKWLKQHLHIRGLLAVQDTWTTRPKPLDEVSKRLGQYNTVLLKFVNGGG